MKFRFVYQWVCTMTTLLFVCLAGCQQEKRSNSSSKKQAAPASEQELLAFELLSNGLQASGTETSTDIVLEMKQEAVSTEVEAGTDVIFVRGLDIAALIAEETPVYGASDFLTKLQPRDETVFAYFRDRLPNSRLFHLLWSPKDRLEEGVIQGLVEQVKEAKTQHNLCEVNCLFITHSTGGLVADHLLGVAESSRDTLDDISFLVDRTVLVIHLGSAAGGSELADFGIDFLLGARCDSWLGFQLSDWLFSHVECQEGAPQLGIVLDLTPSTARSKNYSNETDIPKLMVSGNGKSFITDITISDILLGENDGIVPAHSSCGATRATAFESCSDTIAYDGEMGSFNAPKQFYRAHYPWILSEENHFQLIHRIFPSEKSLSESLAPNVPLYPLEETADVKTSFLFFEKEVQVLSRSNTHTTADIILDVLKQKISTTSPTHAE